MGPRNGVDGCGKSCFHRDSLYRLRYPCLRSLWCRLNFEIQFWLIFVLEGLIPVVICLHVRHVETDLGHCQLLYFWKRKDSSIVRPNRIQRLISCLTKTGNSVLCRAVICWDLFETLECLLCTKCRVSFNVRLHHHHHHHHLLLSPMRHRASTKRHHLVLSLALEHMACLIFTVFSIVRRRLFRRGTSYLFHNVTLIVGVILRCTVFEFVSIVGFVVIFQRGDCCSCCYNNNNNYYYYYYYYYYYCSKMKKLMS